MFIVYILCSELGVPWLGHIGLKAFAFWVFMCFWCFYMLLLILVLFEISMYGLFLGDLGKPRKIVVAVLMG